ncbi:hypothetical protein B0J11DRAFT_477736 [Dendryphion nanum]|uniref:PWWP domain-containing protein n=1 Tax=Dendryphion nanum TaxID=256645 RepID=A0A9P9EH19_9PLEO|nr:hypothetical protein B0J11DRAFT_477736 [Dendryphion nanum]
MTTSDLTTLTKVGTYVLYKPPNASERPGWPAVVCTQDELPQVLRRQRLPAFEVAIYMLQKNESRWVSVGDLHPLDDLQCPEHSTRDYPGLQQAYELLIEALQEVYDLSFWRTCIVSRFGEDAFQDRFAGGDSPSYEQTTVKRAMSPSTAHQHRQNGGPRKRQREAYHRTQSPSSPSPHEPRFTLDVGHKPERSAAASQGREWSAQQTYEQAPHEQLLDEPEGDEIENNSKFVKFVVGEAENREEFYITYEIVKGCPYFGDDNLGFIQKKDNGWIFERPCLRGIDPEDFRFVTEFLWSGEFGFRAIETDDDRSQNLAQCVAAWEVAEKLGMEDLMEHVVKKILRSAPWKHEEILVAAGHIYNMPGTPLPVYREMKDQVTDFIFRNYTEYIEDYCPSYIRTMHKYPELMADVYQKLAYQARTRVETQNEELYEAESQT